ncbi:uncharacterized protein LOC6541673 [Drosophila erecta]|uniref:Uncharacterized protein n=1 Tax=Drosophila erecta TaxID=7220 RepID=B3N5Z4_DROER|nr:uncharacterized protein LOC6541673 [Drosophila erecta]EDV58032.2 uncharacterized protein Dere_GG25164 [Drosophila erecta]
MACKKKTKLWESMAKDELKTTTQAMLEEGAKGLRTISTQQKKLVNFQSFNMDDPRYGISVIEDNMEPPLLSSYTRQYSQPYPNRCKPFVQKTETPDPIFNRKPKNDFEFTTGLDFKFLDDHMHNLSEARKKVNFFRQLRNQSFLLY